MSTRRALAALLGIFIVWSAGGAACSPTKNPDTAASTAAPASAVTASSAPKAGCNGTVIDVSLCFTLSDMQATFDNGYDIPPVLTQPDAMGYSGLYGSHDSSKPSVLVTIRVDTDATRGWDEFYADRGQLSHDNVSVQSEKVWINDRYAACTVQRGGHTYEFEVEIQGSLPDKSQQRLRGVADAILRHLH